MIEHHTTCDRGKRDDTTDIDIGDDEVARNCNHCGAFEIIKQKVSGFAELAKGGRPAEPGEVADVHEIATQIMDEHMSKPRKELGR